MVLPAASIAETFTATGTVIDEKRNPVPGATVQLISDEIRDASWAVLGTTTSGANGTFYFGNVVTGSYCSRVKVKATYVHDGTTYASELTNMRWYDTSNGLVRFSPDDTRLYHYPVSDHGYVWGTVLDSVTNGRMLASTIYLTNATTTLTAQSSANNSYTYQIEAAPGDYEIYAVHDAGDHLLVSPRTRITIAPTYSLYEAAPMTLVADRVAPTPSPSPAPAPTAMPASQTVSSPTPVPTTDDTGSDTAGVKLLPLTMALAIGVLGLFAGWSIMRR